MLVRCYKCNKLSTPTNSFTEFTNNNPNILTSPGSENSQIVTIWTVPNLMYLRKYSVLSYLHVCFVIVRNNYVNLSPFNVLLFPLLQIPGFCLISCSNLRFVSSCKNNQFFIIYSFSATLNEFSFLFYNYENVWHITFCLYT